jgi:hypothetical protein
LLRSNSGSFLKPACCDIAQNVDSVRFREKISAFAKLLHTGGIYFLYYAGHGMEINASFHFIPKGAQDESECISIGEVMAHFDKMAPVGCQVIFCINACRERQKSSICDPFDNEYGRSNKYYILFSTSSGEEVPLEELVFQEVVATFMPQFTCDNALYILDQIKENIQTIDEQQNPRLFCGGLLDPSSRASSGSSFSFATPAKWTDLLQGQCSSKFKRLLQAFPRGYFQEMLPSVRDHRFQLTQSYKSYQILVCLTV